MGPIRPLRLCLVALILSSCGYRNRTTRYGTAAAVGRNDPEPAGAGAGSGDDDDNLTDRRRSPPTPPPADACDCYRGPSSSSTTAPSSSSPGAGARLAYLISVHNARTIADATHLFRAIRYARTIIIIHVDTKVPWTTYLNSTLHDEVESCPCGSTVTVESKFSPHWGKWDMNDPTHWAMDLLTNDIRFRGMWDVFLNLSGDSLPVLTPDAVQALFDPTRGPLRDTNFVTSSACETGLRPTSVWEFPDGWHKKSHYTTDEHGEYVGDSVLEYVDDAGVRRRQKMTTHFGSQWVALLPDFVMWVVNSLKREDSLPSVYREEFRRTGRLMSDETFLTTLLVNTYPFNETLPRLLEGGNLASYPEMYSIRYERMDEHYPTAFGLYPTQQRYDVPESSEADKPRVWGPYFLGVYDLANIINHGALFVRKVSVTVDPNIVRLLPVRDRSDLPYIQWPEELELTKKPDWNAKKAELLLARMKEKKKKKKKKKKEQEVEAKEMVL